MHHIFHLSANAPIETHYMPLCSVQRNVPVLHSRAKKCHFGPLLLTLLLNNVFNECKTYKKNIDLAQVDVYQHDTDTKGLDALFNSI